MKHFSTYALIPIAAVFCCGVFGCDPLVENPEIAVPTIAIVIPEQNTSIEQPGRSIKVELTVEGCLEVEEISLHLGTSEVQDLQVTYSEETNRYQAALETTELFEMFLYGPSNNRAVDLQARLVCADYQQKAQSNSHRIFLSPFSKPETATSSIYHLQPGPRSGEVLALTEHAMTLFFHPEGVKSIHGSPEAMVRQVGDNLYYWMDCTDVWCFNKTGTLFHLTTTLGIRVPERLELPDTPVDIVAAPDPSRLLIAVSGKVFEPKLVFSDTDFGNISEHKLTADPVAPARRQGNEVLMIGFPRFGGASKVYIVRASANESVSSTSVELDWEKRDTLWTLSSDGKRAAILLRGGDGSLALIETTDGSVKQSKVVTLPEETTWRSIKFVGDTELLVVTDKTVRLHSFSTGQEIWRVKPDSGVQAAAVIPDGRFALLSDEMEIIVLDSRGKTVSQSSALPKSWRLTSNLLATDKHLFFGLDRFLAGYALGN